MSETSAKQSATSHDGDAAVLDHVITARVATAEHPEGISQEPTADEVTLGKGMQVTRRGLIAGCAGITALVVAGGVGKAFAGDGDLLRPPGGQDEANLLGACIKCDRCRSACPLNAIAVGHLEDGFVNARTPVMNFDLGYCDFCEGHDGFRCVQACPTQALQLGFDPQLDCIGMAEVDTQECLLYRSGAGMCSKQCIPACPYGAVSQTSNGGLQVDEALCNGCGACHYVCPSASYGTYTGSGLRGINIWPLKGASRER